MVNLDLWTIIIMHVVLLPFSFILIFFLLCKDIMELRNVSVRLSWAVAGMLKRYKINFFKAIPNSKHRVSRHASGRPTQMRVVLTST